MSRSFLQIVTAPVHRAFVPVCTLVGFLALPLALLLFSQWPLRELLQAYSRQANDLGQVVFAFYVAVAVTAASRSDAHLASFKPAGHGAHRPRWRAWAMLACIAPWALFMLWSGWSLMAGSVASLEKFAETQMPGYFLIKLAMACMVLLILLDAVVSLVPEPSGGNVP